MKKIASRIANDILVKTAEPRWMEGLEPGLREKIRKLRAAPYAPGGRGKLNTLLAHENLMQEILNGLSEKELNQLRKFKLLGQDALPWAGEFSPYMRTDAKSDFLRTPLSKHKADYDKSVETMINKGYKNWEKHRDAGPPRRTRRDRPDLPKDPPPKTKALANIPRSAPPPPKGMGRGKLLALGALGIGALSAGGYGIHRALSDDEEEKAAHFKTADTRWLQEMEPELQKKLRDLRGMYFVPGEGRKYRPSETWNAVEKELFERFTPADEAQLRKLRLVGRYAPFNSSTLRTHMKSFPHIDDPLHTPMTKHRKDFYDTMERIRQKGVAGWEGYRESYERMKNRKPRPRYAAGFKAPLPQDPIPVAEAVAEAASKAKGKGKLWALGALGLGALGLGGYGAHRALSEEDVQDQ